MATTVPTATVLPAAAGAEASSTKRAPGSTQDRFLSLLVAQMRNQDPLNPLDNAQVTSQMAQLSTVRGIEDLNGTMKSLAASFGEARALQASALVGRQVLVAGDQLTLAGGRAPGGFALPQAADRVAVEVLDANGAVIHRVELGALAAGLHSLEWDGGRDDGAAAAEGAYRFRVVAKNGSASVAAEPLAAARVLGVAREADGIALDLGSLGRRSYADVRQVF